MNDEILQGQRTVVGIADMKVSATPGDLLITYALGSCLGITVYDPLRRVGGLLHVMLPDSSIDPEKGLSAPFMFIDTGVPLLFKACYALGGEKARMLVKVAGGASINDLHGVDHFQIGPRNIVMLRKLLWRNGVLISAESVGGGVSRTVSLDVESGCVTIVSRGKRQTL